MLTARTREESMHSRSWVGFFPRSWKLEGCRWMPCPWDRELVRCRHSQPPRGREGAVNRDILVQHSTMSVCVCLFSRSGFLWKGRLGHDGKPRWRARRHESNLPSAFVPSKLKGACVSCSPELGTVGRWRFVSTFFVRLPPRRSVWSIFAWDRGRLEIGS